MIYTYIYSITYLLICVQGVALLGGKSSGKTTLICSLLAALNGKCANKNQGTVHSEPRCEGKT